MKSFRKKIIFILTFILVASSCFQLNEFPFLRSVMSLSSKLVFVISFLLFIPKLKKCNYTYLILISIYFIYLIYNTIAHSAEYMKLVPIYMKFAGVVMLCSPYMVANNKDVVIILSKSFKIVVFLNFLQMLFLPGIFGEGFLIASNYNQFGSILCITMILSYLEFLYTGIKLKMIVSFIVCFLTVAIPGSMTAVLSMLLLIFFYLYKCNVKMKRMMLWGVLSFILFFFFIFVIAQRFQLYSDISIANIVEKLGKDVTFSGRTTIWLYALTYIIVSPLTGMGYYDPYWALDNLAGVNSHNLILDTLLQGGIILLLLLLTLIVYVCNLIKRTSNVNIQLALYFTLCIFMLMSQMEVYNYFMIFIFLFVLILGSQYDKSSYMRY